MNPAIKACPHCGVMVVPQSDGTCNACANNFDDPPTEASRRRATRPVVVVYKERKQSFAIVGTLSAILFIAGLLQLVGIMSREYTQIVICVGLFFLFVAHIWLTDAVSEGDGLRRRACLYIPFLCLIYVQDTWRESRAPFLLWTASIFCGLMGYISLH